MDNKVKEKMDNSQKNNSNSESRSYSTEKRKKNSSPYAQKKHSHQPRQQNYHNNQNSNYHHNNHQNDRVPLPILICVSEDYYDSIIETNYRLFKRIQDKTNVYKLTFDSEIEIPESNQKIIRIFDRYYDKKNKASDMLVRNYLRDFLRHDRFGKITMLIPEGIVALFIGKQGNQIKNLMNDCKTKIVVNQPINEVTHRTVEIGGDIEDVIYSCKAVCKAQERISRQKNIGNFEGVKPKNNSIFQSKISVKFIFHQEICDFLDENNGRFLSDLCQNQKVKIDIEDGYDYKIVNPDERVCLIKGYLQSLENAIYELLNRIYHSDCSLQHHTLKMMIPNNFVTKLIGQNGCMVRELAAKSGGAQIKILSNKKTERNLKDCIVTINGSLDNKRQASLLIIRQIEIFKNGGPLLISGKALGKNPAQQYMHSTQAREHYGPELDKRGRMDSYEINNPMNRPNKYVKYDNSDFNKKPQGNNYNNFKRGYEDEFQDRNHGEINSNLGRGRNNRMSFRKENNRYPEQNNQNRNFMNRDYNNKEFKNEYRGNNKDFREKEFGNDFRENNRMRGDRRDLQLDNRQQEFGFRNDRRGGEKKGYNNYRRERDMDYGKRGDRLKDYRMEGFEEGNNGKKNENFNRRDSRHRPDERRENRPDGRIENIPNERRVEEEEKVKVVQKKQYFNNEISYENNEKKDPNKNISFVNPKSGDLKIKQTIIIPNYLIYFFLKEKKKVSKIEKENKCKIQILREDELNLKLDNNVKGRLVRFKGTPKNCISAIGEFTNLLINIETSLNGKRLAESKDD